MPHVYRPIKRTPEEAARLKAVREYFSREKPSFEEETAGRPVLPLGEYLGLRDAARRPSAALGRGRPQ